MCGCGGAKGTAANATSAQLGQTQQVNVPQPSPEQVTQEAKSVQNALANAAA